MCCARTQALGPARLSALIWRPGDLQASTQEFHRNSGLLNGELIVLAIFVLLTALINRNDLYILFAGWLVVNLRLGALSAGWDTQWLGHMIPCDWLLQGRLITIALYYVLTLTLFAMLFKDDLAQIGHKSLVPLCQWTCLPLLVLSCVLTSAQFLPLFWLLAGVGIPALLYLLVRIRRKTRSSVASWYGAAICITLFASLYELVAAASGLKGWISSVNSVTAALSSGLLAALAIAEQMRQEHEQRLRAQDQLVHTFEAMPIGLFTLNRNGRFTSDSPALLGMWGTDLLAKGGTRWQDHFAEGTWTKLHRMVREKALDEMEVQWGNAPGEDASKRFLVTVTLSLGRIEGSLQDVTARHRFETELRIAKVKAEAAS